MESIRSSLTHLHGFQLLCCCHSLSLFFTEITFFRLYQTDKSSESKVKFRNASNRCKRVLEAPKLPYANKTKESITSLALRTFGKLQIVFSTKVNLLYLLYSMAWRCSASDKAKLFAENFSKNSNLDDPGISLPVFPSKTSLKLHNIFLTPRMVKTIIVNLDLSKTFCLERIPVVAIKTVSLNFLTF